MLVSPANRTRALSSGNEVLTARDSSSGRRIDSTPTTDHPLGEMKDSGPAAGWWGYAEGNPTLVGIVVAIVVVAAVIFMVRKYWKR